MWVRSDLKARAKQVLNTNYWKFVLVALVLAMISGSSSSGSSGVSSNSDAFSSLSSGSSEETITLLFTILAIALVVFLIIFVITFALSVFLFNPIQVGCQRFFIKGQTENPKLGELVFAFSSNYKNIVKIMFLRSLYTALWSLLFIVPGIIKSYEYMMIPYLLAENPDMDSEEAFALTKKMMDGNKWDTFVLGLSFLGWEILSVFTCGILSIFYVNPYYYLTYAELYKTLKQRNGLYF